MGYAGQSITVECSRGGLNGYLNNDAMEPFMMVSPSRNINIGDGSRRKRGGTGLVNAGAFSGSPAVVGIYCFTMLDLTKYIICASSAGNVYKDDTNTIATGLSTTTYFSFETGENKLFICDGLNAPQVWPGTGSAAAIAHAAADWTTYPCFQLIKHGYGNSERMWGINQIGVYAGKLNDFEDFQAATLINLPIDTGDSYGLVGAVEFGDRLIAFSKKKAYIIDDTNSDTTKWGYQTSIFSGGVASWRVIARVPNDVICMMDDGEIYSITAVQSYGDYKSASLTRPSWMHKWVQDNVRLSYIENFHAVYDPVLRAVKFFVVRNGNTTVDTALVYFIDRPPAEAWIVHDGKTTLSGYKASSSALVEKSIGSYAIYTGGSDGYVWELEKPTRNDGGYGYYGGFRTPSMSFKDIRGIKQFKRGLATMIPKGSYNLYVDIYVDGQYKSQTSVDLLGGGVFLDTFVLDTDTLADSIVKTQFYDIGYLGERIQLEFYNTGLNQDFDLHSLTFDMKTMGARVRPL